MLHLLKKDTLLILLTVLVTLVFGGASPAHSEALAIEDTAFGIDPDDEMDDYDPDDNGYNEDEYDDFDDEDDYNDENDDDF